MRRTRGRPTVRERVLALNAADRYVAWLGGKEPIFQQTVPAERKHAERDPSKIYEKDVLADVLMALRRDPRVALVMRQQSGVFIEGARHIRVGTPGILDISLMLVGGRYGEIECKRPGQRPDERQAERIETIKRNGGIAGYATSAAEALALLP